jgi:hypothetical protein
MGIHLGSFGRCTESPPPVVYCCTVLDAGKPRAICAPCCFESVGTGISRAAPREKLRCAASNRGMVIGSTQSSTL